MAKRQIFLGVTAVLGTWLAVAAILLGNREQGLFALLATQQDLRAAQARSAVLEGQLKSDAEKLQTRAAALAGKDRRAYEAAIEAAAREELDMVFPGERVVRIPEEAPGRP